MLQAIVNHRRALSTGRVRCPFCGLPKPRGLRACEGCGALWSRRPTLTGWVLIGSILLLPVFLWLLRKAPDVVAPKRWRER